MSGALTDLLAGPALAAGNLLDVRPAAAFAAGHLRGSVSWPLEAELAAVPEAERSRWLADRLPSILLPPRHDPLAVLAADGALARVVAADLSGRGRVPVTGYALQPADLATLPPDVVARGPSRRCLWRPPPFLVRWRHLLPVPAAGPVLDLACGSGRAAVWLAERGWRVTGVDHQPEALGMARRLADLRGVRVDLIDADLRRPDSLPAGPWAAMLMFRYLERPLVRRLPGVLQPGSVVMLRTFRAAPGYVGNPRPSHRLARDEAARLLPSPPAEVLVHEEGFDPDGRPAAGVVVRWPG